MNFLDAFARLVEDLPDLVQIVGLDDRPLAVSASWCRKLGIRPEEAGELSFSDLVHPEDRRAYAEVLKTASRGEAVAQWEGVLVSRRGRELRVEGSCSRTRLPSGDSGFLHIFRDVTERKRAEDVLARQAAELVKAGESLEEKERHLAEALEQARKYREAQERAQELARINEELTAEVDRRTQAEARIRVSLREKEVLLKEVHHRVKNNLQVITSLLNLQSGQIADAATQEMFLSARNRIRSMSMIHEMLYSSDDLARVDLSDYLRNLSAHLVRSFAEIASGVRLNLNVTDVHLSIDAAIACGLIVNELITNSLKHAFKEKEGGTLNVNCQRVETDGFELVVEDDGKGMSDEFRIAEAQTLGLQLVESLVGQLEGTLEIQHGDPGTRIRIVFDDAAPSAKR